MSNAKQYTDLTKAQTLQKTSLFAVAQEGETELQTVTAEQIAEPVAEVLSTGALAELEYATSQGKNAIATALTNKGVATDASETLIQMADKVNNLTVDSTFDKLVGSIYYNGGNTNQSALSLTPLASCKLVNGYVATTASGTLYVYKMSGAYSSIAEALAAAEMSIALQNKPSSNAAYLTCSKDGKTIISHAFDDAGTVDIYSVDYDAKSLQYIKSITGVTLYRGQTRMAITNDRSLIAWYAAWSTTTYIMQVDTGTKSSSLNVQLSGKNAQLAFDDENNILYALNDADHQLNKYTYEVEDDAINFTTTTIAISAYPQYLDKETLLLFGYGNVVQDTSNVYYANIYIADATKDSIVYASAKVYYIFPATSLPGTTWKITPVNSGCPIINTTDNSIYTIEYALPNITLHYDRTANSISVSGESYQFVTTSIFVSYSSYSTDTVATLLCYNTSTKYYAACPIGSYNDPSGSSIYVGDRICYAQADTDKLLGYKHSVNNVVAKFTYPSYSVSDMNNGMFDLTTSIVELS